MSSDGARKSRAMLDAWREQGADRLDPVRFQFIAALDRRAATHSGEARRILDNRLSRLMEAYAADIHGSACGAVDTGSAVAPEKPARGALAGLTDYIARRTRADEDAPATNNAVPGPSPWPDIDVLDYLRDVWSKVRTEKLLRQSLEEVPGNTGPLNSSSLVHRSLLLMRELSPGYLQQFLSYVDALSRMDQMNGGAQAEKDVPRAGNTRKSVRGNRR